MQDRTADVNLCRLSSRVVRVDEQPCGMMYNPSTGCCGCHEGSLRVERRSVVDEKIYSFLLRFFWLGDDSFSAPSELEVGISEAAL